MTGPRRARPDEYPRILALANRIFVEPGSRRGMDRRVPELIGPHNARRFWVMTDRGRIVSMAGSVIRPVQLGGVRVRTAFLGAVCTDAAYRGRGLATGILGALRASCVRAGCDLMMISGDRGLYLRMHARPVGRLAAYTLPTAKLRALTPLCVRLRPVGVRDLAVVMAIQRREPVRVVRRPEEWRRVFATGWAGYSPGRFHLVEMDGSPVAYLIAGRAGSWGGSRGKTWRYVVEYGGDRRCLLAGLGRLPVQHVKLFVPWYDRTMMDLLRGAARPRQWGPAYDSTVILNGPRLLRRSQSLRGRRIGALRRLKPAALVRRLFGSPTGAVRPLLPLPNPGISYT